MKPLTVILCAALLAGCAGRHPRGTAHYDDYDAVNVEQMVGNNVSSTIFAKTIICLNARRESRRITALTNVVVTAATNQTVSAVTNQTISVSTNLVFTSMTNLAPAASVLSVPPTGDAATGFGNQTNVVVVVAASGPSTTTNTTVTLAQSLSGSSSPAQRTANYQFVRTLNHQLTTTSNNLSVAVMTNLVVTIETNIVVNYLTNSGILSATNLVIAPTNGVVHDYFLYSELIPPPDFTLAQGESLILLVDGVRYGFTPGQSGTAFVGRKGYASTLYRVPPEVLVAIANAKEVRVRFKGVNSVVERSLSAAGRRNFRDFLARYFVPEKTPASPQKTVAALGETTHVANR